VCITFFSFICYYFDISNSYRKKSIKINSKIYINGNTKLTNSSFEKYKKERSFFFVQRFYYLCRKYYNHFNVENMNRRDFLKTSLLAGGALWLPSFESAYAKGKADKMAGKRWKGWKKGQFQVHFIHTGVAESMFFIFPDGTSMLLDCGDHDALKRGELAVPVLPNPNRHAGEWIARYVLRANPDKEKVDYMMLSHYHSDHAGRHDFYASEDIRDGEPYYLSGFAQAAEFLNFGKAFDRAYPDYTDPIPLNNDVGNAYTQMKRFYEYQEKHRGMKVEKFQVGAIDQVKMLRKPNKYTNFSIRNICGNGRIALPDGSIRDIYKEKIDKEHPTWLNENGMSLGMIISYGKFKFYTAGDFSDRIKNPDGKEIFIEDEIADAVEPCQVTKINHHGHHSMSKKLVAALRSKVYVSCVWDNLHTLDDTMTLVTDRTLYPDERIVCPTIFTERRLKQDSTKPWLPSIPTDTYTGCHIVLNVEPGGDRYSISFIDAQDESMTVKSVLHFNS